MSKKIFVIWQAHHEERLSEFAEEEREEAIRSVRDLIFEDHIHPADISVYLAEPTNFGVQVGGLTL